MTPTSPWHRAGHGTVAMSFVCQSQRPHIFHFTLLRASMPLDTGCGHSPWTSVPGRGGSQQTDGCTLIRDPGLREQDWQQLREGLKRWRGKWGQGGNGAEEGRTQQHPARGSRARCQNGPSSRLGQGDLISKIFTSFLMYSNAVDSLWNFKECSLGASVYLIHKTGSNS